MPHPAYKLYFWPGYENCYRSYKANCKNILPAVILTFTLMSMHYFMLGTLDVSLHCDLICKYV